MTTHPAVQKPQSAATRVWPMRCKRMQVFLVAHAFNGENFLAHGFGRQGVAGIERRAIHQNAARAATGAIAAPVGARQAQLHRNHFPQRGARFVFGGIGLPLTRNVAFSFANGAATGTAGAHESRTHQCFSATAVSTTPDPAALRKFLRE